MLNNNLVTYEIIENVAYIGLNQPERLNVLSIKLVSELNYVIKLSESNETVKLIILFGHGRGFCAGGDLKEFYELSKKPQHDHVKDWEYINSCKLPVIAAIHGYAIGGGLEILMMCDYVIACKNTIFSQPELNLGFIPGCGATQRLPKKIGKGNAFNIIASGERIDSTTAEKLGLVNEIADQDQHLNLAIAKSSFWAKRTRNELIKLKQAINGNFEQEREIFYEMLCSKAAKEKIQKFLQKNKL